MSNNYLYRLVGRAFVLIGLLSQLPSAKGKVTSIPIKHFIFIIQENHSFDNYFPGTFPGANGIPAELLLQIIPAVLSSINRFLLRQHNIPQ